MMRVTSCALGFCLVVAGCSADEPLTNQRDERLFNNAGNLSAGQGTTAAGTGAATAGTTAGISSPTAGAPTAGAAPQGGDMFINACAEGTAQVSRVTPDVILVIDGSCSMSSEYPSNGRSASSCQENATSRWAALRNALLDPTNGIVTRLAGAIRFGLVVFGTAPACPIPLEVINPVIDNYPAIDTGFPNLPPGMFTPTGAALDWVYDNMAGAQEVLDQDLGPQIVLLATDGEPNSCEDPTTNYQPSVDAANKGAGKGIKTYVISLADSAGQFHDHLQQLADIGSGTGSGTLYEPTTPEQLAADLEILIGGVVGCEMALNGEVTTGSECLGQVALNGNQLPCNEADGWVLADPRHIRLQGAACNNFKTAQDAQLHAAFPCDVFTPD